MCHLHLNPSPGLLKVKTQCMGGQREQKGPRRKCTTESEGQGCAPRLRKDGLERPGHPHAPATARQPGPCVPASPSQGVRPRHRPRRTQRL